MAGVAAGASIPATPVPVVDATALAVGLLPNSPPTVEEKLVNSELRPWPPPAPPPNSASRTPNPLIIPSAESSAFTPVLIDPNPAVTTSIEPTS